MFIIFMFSWMVKKVLIIYFSYSHMRLDLAAGAVNAVVAQLCC